MTQYQQLRESSLDTTDLGFLIDNAISPVLGTDITGSIRFLAHENHIFAAQSSHSYLLAENFEDFLGLILACGNAELLCRIPCWTRLRFQRELSRYQPSHKQQMICNALKNCFQPPVINDPYGYVQRLQQAPEHQAQQQTTTTVQLGIRQWQAKNLRILDQDATLDVCIRIPGEQVVSFYDRWEGIIPDAEQLQEKAATDPFALQTRVRATIGCTAIGTEILEQLHWDPLCDNSAAAQEALHRLQLNREDGWIMLQLSLQTGKRKKKPIRSLSLELICEEVTIPGPKIRTPLNDDLISMIHPVTGNTLSLTVHSATAEALDPNFLTNPPCYYTRLCYCMDPPMSQEAFRVFDPVPNDPLQAPPGCAEPYPDSELENAPTAALAEPDDTLPSHIRSAFSARHYRPRNAVEWHTAFCCKRYPDGVLPIIR
jgi:hypothetical protein